MSWDAAVQDEHFILGATPSSVHPDPPIASLRDHRKARWRARRGRQRCRKVAHRVGRVGHFPLARAWLDLDRPHSLAVPVSVPVGCAMLGCAHRLPGAWPPMRQCGRDRLG